MEWKGGRYESQGQWCTVSHPDVRSSQGTTLPQLPSWLDAAGSRRWEKRPGPQGVFSVVEFPWGPGFTCVLGGVLLSRTLAGAVPSALSGLASGFGMDYRAFPCRCDHRDDYMGSTSDRRPVRLFGCCPAAVVSQAHAHQWCTWALCDRVGCGPYSGRFTLTQCSPPTRPKQRVRGMRYCLCWPISTSQLTNRYRSSTPGLSTQ